LSNKALERIGIRRLFASRAWADHASSFEKQRERIAQVRRTTIATYSTGGDERRHGSRGSSARRTVNRVTESLTPAVVPGGAAAGQTMRRRGSIGRRFTQPRFTARNPAIVRGCADLAISASNIESSIVGVSAAMAKSPDNCGLSASAAPTRVD
jgi:hypothetical protein